MENNIDMQEPMKVKDNSKLMKIANDMMQKEDRVWTKLNINSGSELYQNQDKQRDYFTLMRNSIDKFFGYYNFTKEEKKELEEIFEEENRHSLNNYIGLKGFYEKKDQKAYIDFHTKMPYMFLNPSNVGPESSYKSNLDTITREEWNKKQKDSKLKTEDGKYYIMQYDDKIGTYLKEVQIVENNTTNNDKVLFVDKRGFQVVEGNNISPVFLHDNGTYYMYKSYIPYDYTSSTIVYFVSGKNGDEFGQFPTKEEAEKKYFQLVNSKMEHGGELESKKQNLLQYLNWFPYDAKSWGQATDELRDIARMARMIYLEVDEKEYPALDFKTLKTPSEWNTEGRFYITDMYFRMSDKAKKEFLENFEETFYNKMKDGGEIKVGDYIKIKDGMKGKLMNIEGENLEVKKITKYNFPSGMRKFYHVEYDGYTYDVREDLVDNERMEHGGEIKEYAVYELYLGQPYNFWNEEDKKWYWSEPEKATLYTKKEAEEKREELLTPRYEQYSKTGNTYKEIHIGNLYQKSLLKKMAHGGELKIKDTYKYVAQESLFAPLRNGRNTTSLRKNDEVKITKLSADGKENSVVANFDGDAILLYKDDLLNSNKFIKTAADGGFVEKTDEELKAMNDDELFAYLDAKAAYMKQYIRPLSAYKAKNFAATTKAIEYKNEGTSKLDENFVDIKKINEQASKDADDYLSSKMAKGGEITFMDKVKAVEKNLLKKKKVPAIVQKDYGKTYDKKEARESAMRIIGSQTAKWKARNKMEKGGKTSVSPLKDRIFGSKKNKPGSASTKTSAQKIELNETIIQALSDKAKDYNEKHSKKVTTNALKAVMRRGMGAFSSSHRPGMTRQGWGYARVNKFLQKKAGKKVKAGYTQDDDLLENGGEIKKEMKVSDKPKFKKLMELEDRARASMNKTRNFSKWNETTGENFRRRWYKMVSELRGWGTDQGYSKSKPEWIKFTEEQGRVEDYNFGDVLA